MTVTRTDLNQNFDTDGNLISEEEVIVDITDEANTAQMVGEQDESVDKLVAVVEALNALTALTNAEINANPAAVIKDLARECKTIARVANREARITSGRTESTDTGTEVDEDTPTSSWTKPLIIDWLVDRGVVVNANAANRFTKDELLDMVAAYLNDDT